MVVRSIFPLFLLVAAIVAPANARDLDDVLLGAKRAAGGEAWNDVKAIRYSFRLRQSGLEGTGDTLVDLVGGRSVTHFHLGVFKGAEGFDGTRSWTQDDAELVTIAGSADLRARAASARYRNALAYWFPVRGRAELSEHMQLFRVRIKEIVTAKPDGGLPFDLWFDAQTRLLERVVEDGASETLTIMYDDYRAVGSLVIAHRIRSSNAAADFGSERIVTNVQINPGIRDSDFAVPRAVAPDFAFARGTATTVVPFRFVNNHIYVDAKLNGQAYSLLVDTGAANLVTPTTAKALGLAVAGDARVDGVGEGSADAAFARVGSVGVGDVTLRNQLFTVVPLEAFADVEGVPFHGIIGYELFKRFVVRIDYDARTMTLTDPRRWAQDMHATAVPIVFNGSVPEADGAIDGITGTFDIDTGSRVSVGLNSPFVQRHALRGQFRPSVEAVTGWGLGGATRGTVARAKRLSIGPLNVDNVVIDMSLHKVGALSHAAPAGTIGSGLLKRFTVTFDYGGEHIYFEPNARTAFGDAYDRSGLWINASPSGFRVDGVVAGSPAAQAGIGVGDVIVNVEGKAAVSLGLPEVRDLLRDSAAGTVIKMTVRSGARLMDVMLRLRDQV
jgi:predicted aspartyl protease